MRIMKFGGTSVGNAEAIRRVIAIASESSEKSVMVVSALAGVTDLLIETIHKLKRRDYAGLPQIVKDFFQIHYEVIEKLGIEDSCKASVDSKKAEFSELIAALETLGEVSPKSQDMLLSFGELLSSRIIYQASVESGLSIDILDPRELIRTDSNHTEAEIIFHESNARIRSKCLEAFESKDIVITGGFVASNQKGHATTLGRGGSDYSAAIIAAALNAELLEIFTDVDGILTCDPRMLPEARLIRRLSYKEASELAFFGAKVLHPKTILPAVEKNIPVAIRNTFRTDGSGTRIIGRHSPEKMVKAIAFRENVTMINIYSNRMLGAFGFLNKVFDIFSHFETSVDLVATSEVNISLTIDDNSNLDKIIGALGKFSSTDVNTECAIISAIGEGIRDTAGMAARFFGVLRGVNIRMVSIGASDVNIGIVIDRKRLKDSVVALHKEFFSTIPDNGLFERIT